MNTNGLSVLERRNIMPHCLSIIVTCAFDIGYVLSERVCYCVVCNRSVKYRDILPA